MKDHLRQLIAATLDRLSLDRVMHRKIRFSDGILSVGGEEIDLTPFKKIIGVAIGKAAFPMAEATAKILQPHLMTGVVVTSAPAPRPLPYFLSYTGGHPYPDNQSVHAANVVRELLANSRPHYLVLYFLSGGGRRSAKSPSATISRLTIAANSTAYSSLVARTSSK